MCACDLYIVYMHVCVCEYTLSPNHKSNEVGGSHQMEKEGLERVLLFLKLQGLVVEVLVTDRHKQINKWLRESYPAITHHYDVWHVAKGNESHQLYYVINFLWLIDFRKKVDAAAKQKGCEIIGNWRRSIINHLYWCFLPHLTVIPRLYWPSGCPLKIMSTTYTNIRIRSFLSVHMAS